MIQLRVLFALLMREMTTRYGRNPGGYVWALIEPVGAVALLSIIHGFVAHRAPLGDSVALFFAIGYMAFHCYADISRAVSAAVSANRPLLAFPRVTILDTIMARFILQLLTVSFVSALVIGGLILAEAEPVRIDMGRILLAVSLASLLAFAVGTLNCGLFARSPTWQTMFGVINRPLFIISGVFFVYEGLPRAAQDILWWNPLVHVTGIMRSGFYPTYEASFASPLYVVLCASAPLMLAILLMKALRADMLEQ